MGIRHAQAIVIGGLLSSALAVAPWDGSHDGLRSEPEIRKLAEERYKGGVKELKLVRLVQAGAGKLGTVNVAEFSDEPLWAVVLDEKPGLKEVSPDATIWVNVRYLSARSGELVYGTEAAIVPD